VAQIVGGVLVYGVSRGVSENSNIHISSWKFLFVMTGCASALYGVMMWFCLADSPITAKWLTDEEKHIAVERLRGNQQGIGSRIFKWYQVKEAFTDIRVCLIYILGC
jgi:MFS transporter, ACS family, allantoate permease